MHTAFTEMDDERLHSLANRPNYLTVEELEELATEFDLRAADAAAYAKELRRLKLMRF